MSTADYTLDTQIQAVIDINRHTTVARTYNKNTSHTQGEVKSARVGLMSEIFDDL